MMPKHLPIVTFVVPVLNGEKYIARCLISIRSQKSLPAEVEIIVIDNGSTDDTQNIVRDFAVRIEVIRGVSVAALRNHGARVARGDYLAFVDADVELSLDWLDTGLVSFRDQTVLAVGGPRCMPEQPTWVQRTWGLHLNVRRPNDRPTVVPWLYSMAFIVRSKEFMSLGGFSEDLKTAEDVDLCYRLGRLGQAVYNPKMKAIHWGEDPDLKTFWWKEVWRGVGAFGGLRFHGLRWDEVPSLGYPIYMLCLLVLLGVTSIVDLANRGFALSLVTIGLIALPAMALALMTTLRSGRIVALPALFFLYLVYGLARAFSIVNAANFKRI